MTQAPSDMPGEGADPLGEIFLEYITLGDSAKVCAIHAATGEEAVAVGPATAPREALEKLAIGKLRRKLSGDDKRKTRRKPPSKPGIVA